MVDEAPVFEQQRRDTRTGVMNHAGGQLDVQIKRAAVAALFEFRSNSA